MPSPGPRGATSLECNTSTLLDIYLAIFKKINILKHFKNTFV